MNSKINFANVNTINIYQSFSSKSVLFSKTTFVNQRVKKINETEKVRLGSVSEKSFDNCDLNRKKKEILEDVKSISLKSEKQLK